MEQDDTAFWEWFDAHTKSDDEFLYVLQRLDIRLWRKIIIDGPAVIRARATAVLQQAGDALRLCACGHRIDDHEGIQSPPKEDEKVYLRGIIIPGRCLQKRCKCKDFSSDNLDWIVKNKGK